MLLYRGVKAGVSLCSYMQDCFSTFRAVLGNILTLELPHRSGYPASQRAFMYLGIYLTLNEAKIAEAGITHSVLF